MQPVLLLLVALPAAGACGGQAVRATGAAFAAALVTGLVVLGDGAFSTVLADRDGQALLGLQADRLAVVLLLLVLGVSAVVQAFAGRYLAADAGARRFTVAAGALTSATALMVSAASLVTFAVGWSLAGLALLRLLMLYPELPAARVGARRTARAFLVADGALWAAVLLSAATWGTIDLRHAGAGAAERAGDPGVVTVVALLLVVAALGRCAQLPLQRWLPATLAAPTPVSALLHAGVVNAGGILLVRTGALAGASSAAMWLAFLAGAATTVYGTVLMLVKPDVKGALAHSTMGQMGLMVMVCGLGAPAAAVLHLVGHGMYKASLFLGSGAAVGRHARHAQAPPVTADAHRARRATVALVLPAAALAAAVSLVHPTAGGARGLILFAAATGTALTWGWLGRRPDAGGVLAVLVTVPPAALAYVLLVRGTTELLGPALAPMPEAVPAALLLVPAIVLAAAVVTARFSAGRDGRLHARLYVLALGAGHVVGGAPRSAPGRRHPASVRRVPAVLLPRTAGRS